MLLASFLFPLVLVLALPSQFAALVDLNTLIPSSPSDLAKAPLPLPPSPFAWAACYDASRLLPFPPSQFAVSVDLNVLIPSLPSALA